ncbi:MAG TPA: presenilin family intramembrane aspartyl protease PSH [Methanospirillum sp.]|nr:presenilin family intramembrane aspartyl protease PSH [Methanospirillum sp.]
MENKLSIRGLLALVAMPVMLIAVEIGAVILAVPMIQSGYAVFEDPSSYENSVWFIVMLLGFTVFLLILLKYHLKRVLQLIIWASLFLSFIYVFTGLLSLTGADIAIVTGGGLLLSAAATILLARYPEWYIVDILGVLLSAGIASIFGISLEPLPVILLLILLAVYDAISVYRTKHMLTLAEGVIENRMPIMVIVPKRAGYSFIRDGIGGKIDGSETSSEMALEEQGAPEEKKDRAAYLMGLGDLIMPSILVVSAAVFMPGSGLYAFSIPTLTTMAGSLVGMALLLHLVSSGRPHAGLPPLNGGAIIGFLIGWILIGL